MTLADELRDALGLPELAAQLDRIETKLDAIGYTKPWFTIDQAARHCRRSRATIEAWLADGTLWKQQGTDSTKVLIPAAALDSLQERPAHLRSVAS